MLATKSLLLAVSVVLITACQTSFQVEHISDGDTTVTKKQPKYEEFVKTGDTLPIESIVDLKGEIIHLKNSNKRKLIILFATWCSDSNRALKALNQSAILNDESIEIIAIAREEDEETVRAWRDKHNIKVSLATDPDRSIYRRFAAAGIPRLITVSQDNKLIKMNLAEGENQLALIEWQ